MVHFMYFRLAGFALLVVVLGCAEPEKPKTASKASPELEKAVRTVVARHLKLNADGIDMGKPLSAVKADDLDIVEIIMDLEEQLEIVIPDSAIDRYGARMTPNDLVAIVSEARANPEPRKKR